ncbi:MAG: DUF1254 domain-containing protein [Chloroflexota bacterium]
MTTPEASTDPLTQLATRAWIYGYPLLYNLEEIDGFVRESGSFPVSAPWNAFGAARDLLGPETRFVTPNNDTLYLMAACDLSGGPLLLEVPDTHDRYYVLQLVDAWTNNVAYIGRRATGTAAGRYLLIGPGQSPRVPEGVTSVHLPTDAFMIVGRVAVDGPDDLPSARATQDGFSLRPLDGATPGRGIPIPSTDVPDDLAWWERMRVSLAAFPPPAADAQLVAALEPLGLTATESPYRDASAELRGALVAGAAAGKATIEQLMHKVNVSPNGWQFSTHVFDYSLDTFEVGTVDSPEWRIADRTQAYALRAVAVRAGLWGNHGYEANYGAIWKDADGQPLDGANRYELRLPADMPVVAFWSLTMYDVPEFYLVANAIDRYSIGDRTPGLVTDPEGFVTIRIQADDPGGELSANWLPAPRAPFRPVMRLYQPRPEALAAGFDLPPIRRIG